MSRFVPMTTESYRKQHLARPEDLNADSWVPGRSGMALCPTEVIDQARADYWRRGITPDAKPLVIADLPLCKRCERAAGRIDAEEARP